MKSVLCGDGLERRLPEEILVRFLVDFIRWEEVANIRKQLLNLLAHTDILLTNPGSGAFSTSLVTAPFCSIKSGSCNYYEHDVLLEQEGVSLEISMKLSIGLKGSHSPLCAILFFEICPMW